MLFEKTPRLPYDVRVEVGTEPHRLEASGEGRWAGAAVEVETTLTDGRLAIAVTSSAEDLRRVILSWRVDVPAGTRVLNDHWERGYGDLEWRGLVPERRLPWYFLAYDGKATHGYGVKTGAGSLCWWQVDDGGDEGHVDPRSCLVDDGKGAQGPVIAEPQLVEVVYREALAAGHAGAKEGGSAGPALDSRDVRLLAGRFG